MAYNKHYADQIQRIIDVKNNIALVQMEGKRTTYTRTENVPPEMLTKWLAKNKMRLSV